MRLTKIAKEVNLFLSKHDFSAEGLAEAIASKAFEYSVDEHFNSPFSQEAKRSGYKFEGGKSDDIAVTVGLVEFSSENDTSKDREDGPASSPS